MAEFLFLGANGSLQDPDSGNTSLLVRGEGGTVCVDLACNIHLAIAAEPDVVVLTHEHIDHVYGLPSFLHQAWLAGRTKPLTIVVPQRMAELAESLLSLFHLRDKKGFFPVNITEEPAFEAGSLQGMLFKTDHTQTSVGVVLTEQGKRLVYTADTRPIKSVPEFMMNADVLIHEASGVAADEEVLVKKGHSSGADAGTLAADAHAGRLLLCHLPQGSAAKAAVLADAKRFYAAAELPTVGVWCKV